MSERGLAAADTRHEMGCVRRYGASEYGGRDTDEQAAACSCHINMAMQMQNHVPQYRPEQLANVYATETVRVTELTRLRAIEAAARDLADELGPGYDLPGGQERALEKLRKALGEDRRVIPKPPSPPPPA